MRIEKFNIDGFGIFNAFNSDDLSANVVLFLGENEAGKSTLMHFIRQMLFGFPKRKGLKNRKRYDALNGGRLGGNISVQLQNGEQFVLERHKDNSGESHSLQKPDGSALNMDILPVELDASREDLYRNIFAFGLDELQNLETLENEHINAIIYSAGAGGGGANLVSVMKSLDKNLEELYRSGGSKPVINRLLKEIHTAQEALHDSQTGIEEYEEKKNDLKGYSEEIKIIEHDLSEKKQKHREVDLLLRTLGDWHDLRQSRKELDALPLIESFPENAKERLGNILQKSEDTEIALTKIKQRIADTEEEYATLNLNEDILAIGPQIKELIEAKVDYEKAANDLPYLEKELQDKKTGLNRKFDDLGSGWNSERLIQTPSSRQTREEIRTHQKKLESTENSLKEAISDRKQKQEKIDDLANTTFAGQTLSVPFFPAIILAAVALIGGVLLWLFINPLSGVIAFSVFAVLATTYHLFRKNMMQKTVHGPDKKHLLEQAKKALDIAQASCNEKQNDYDKTLDNWKTWLKQYGLSPELMTDSALDMVNEIKEAKLNHEEIISLKNRVANVKKTKEDFEHRVTALLDKSGESVAGNVIPSEAISELNRRLEVQTKTALHRENLEKELKNYKKEYSEHVADRENATLSLNNLLAEAGAQHIDEFRQRQMQWEQRTQLQKTIGDLEKRLQKESGSEERLKWLENVLHNADKLALENEQEEIHAEIDRLEIARTTVHEKMAVLKDRLAVMEKQTETSELLVEKESLKTQLDEKAKQWAVNKIAKSLLEKARERYEKEHQPAVMKEAEKHFEAITGEKYKHIQKPLDGGQMYVVDKDGQTKNANGELSRGTAEELYLSVRLGLITDFSKKEEPLPVIMDDIFVNFDDKRRRQAVKSIKKLSETNQVLFFTCHSEIAAIVKEEIADAKIVNLNVSSSN